MVLAVAQGTLTNLDDLVYYNFHIKYNGLGPINPECPRGRKGKGVRSCLLSFRKIQNLTPHYPPKRDKSSPGRPTPRRDAPPEPRYCKP